MCGIVGYITTQNDIYENARRGFFQYALMLDTLRGPDSTGVITVSKKFTVNRYKTLSSGFRLATSDAFENDIPNGWCSIGHNRSATRGAVTVENAHPFKFGRISLVHNGTLSYAGSSLPTFDHKLAVDSMQIAASLAAVPAKEAHKVLSKIDGDFALVWVDERDRSINMCRNSQRPLHIGFNYDKSFLVFMSDASHLDILVKSFKHTSANVQNIYSLDPFQQLKYKRGSLCPEVIEFDPFVRTPVNYGMFPSTPTSKNMKTGSTGISSPGSLTSREKAEQRKARRKWSESKTSPATDMSSMGGPVAGSGLAINRLISPYDGVVPKTNTKGMLESLKRYFDVSPDQLTKFTPEDTYELTDRIYQVVGSVIAEGWGGVEWEGCINFVTKQKVDSAMGQDWLVRPIGLTRNRSADECPAILCELVTCDWDKYEKSRTAPRKSLVIVPKDGSSRDDDLVLDPDGRLINRALLQKRLDKGCVSCENELNVKNAWAYATVNDGQDVVCEACKWDLEWPAS